MSLFWFFLLSFGLSAVLLYPWILYLRKHNFTGKVESHHLQKSSIPNAAGVVLMLLLNIIGIPLAISHHMTFLLTPLLLTLPLSLIGWLDDFFDISIWQRMTIYSLCVALGLVFVIPIGGGIIFLPFLGSWSVVLDFIILFLLWLGFMNFFNFMDGMDGMSAVHIIFYGLGVAVWSSLYTFSIGFLSPFAIITMGLGFGFLTWNRYPAKVYLGDSGSIPMGYFLGTFGVILFLLHYGAYAFILTLYYWGDAGVTLLFRIIRGEKFWLSHNQHFFRQALNRWSERAVLVYVIIIESVLLGLAVASFYWNWWMLIPALLWVIGWLIYFKRG